MEPKSWQLVQGVLIGMALVIGIGFAVWYENRPIAAPLPVVASKSAPTKKKTVAIAGDDVIPAYAPVPSLASDTPSAGVAPAGSTRQSGTAGNVAASRGTLGSWQETASDPLARPDTAPSASQSQSAYSSNITSSAELSPNSQINPLAGAAAQAQNGYSAPAAYQGASRSSSSYGAAQLGSSTSPVNSSAADTTNTGAYASPNTGQSSQAAGASSSNVSPMATTAPPTATGGGSYLAGSPGQ